MTKYLSPLYSLPLTALALICLLLVSVLSHMSALQSGREMTVPAMGYDPRAILLGHYVRLVPDAESELTPTASAEAIAAFDIDNQRWATVEGWVLMESGPSGWRATRLSVSRPDIADDSTSILLQGMIGIRREQSLDGALSPVLSVTPPIEIDRYYANVDEALALEKILMDRESRGDVRLILSVSRDGKARLKGLEVDGVRKIMGWW